MTVAADKTNFPLSLTKGETFRVKIVPKSNGVPRDLTGWSVTLSFRNGQFLTHTSPSDIVSVDGSEITIVLPSDLVNLLVAHKPNYEIVASDPQFADGFGDFLILAGRIKES